MTQKNATEKTSNPSSKEIVLSNGVKAVIYEGKGSDTLKAAKMVSGQEEMIPALISLLTEFDGKKMPMEEILDFSMGDYMHLVEEFNKINPLSPSLKSSS